MFLTLLIGLTIRPEIIFTFHSVEFLFLTWFCVFVELLMSTLHFLCPFRLLELHSPDGQHTVVLRCKDGSTANSWFTAIHTNIAALLPQTLAHINAYLGASSTTSTHPHLKHIGWLAEQVPTACTSGHGFT